MDIVMIPTADIQPNEYNPNVVPERIMEQLKKSIERGGIEQPVLVRKDGNKFIT
jgi:ParB-like chromosome segregation protein Spo0J